LSGVWYRRMGDIPGLDYSPPVRVNRETLPGHDREPEIREIEALPGEYWSFLSWPGMVEEPPGPDDDPEEGPAYRPLDSPPREHLTDALDDASIATDMLVGRLWEALELPGGPEDYRSALDRVCERLEERKLTEPSVLQTVESIAWLAVRLATACRDIAIADKWSNVGFRTLIDLYRGEGFLREALEVAELERPFLSDPYMIDDFEGRLETIRGEGGG
jgi:hypothetical protein